MSAPEVCGRQTPYADNYLTALLPSSASVPTAVGLSLSSRHRPTFQSASNPTIPLPRSTPHQRQDVRFSIPSVARRCHLSHAISTRRHPGTKRQGDTDSWQWV